MIVIDNVQIYGCYFLVYLFNNFVILVYKFNFIWGGFILNMYYYYFVNDVIGWVGYMIQFFKIC